MAPKIIPPGRSSPIEARSLTGFRPIKEPVPRAMRESASHRVNGWWRSSIQTMNGPFTVWHLNSLLHGGAAIAARRLHDSMVAAGIDSRFASSAQLPKVVIRLPQYQLTLRSLETSIKSSRIPPSPVNDRRIVTGLVRRYTSTTETVNSNL